MNKSNDNTCILVSIVTIVLNGEDQIKQTIDSVLKQAYNSIEYIIVDGGSCDSTIDKIKQYKDGISILISEQDNGIYNAINKGIKIASGAIIGILHCGDYYCTPNAITEVVEAYRRTESDVIYGDMITLGNKSEVSSTKVCKSDHLLLYKYMSIFHPASFVCKRCYDINGYYDEGYKSASDYDFFLKLATRNASFFHVDVVLACFALGGLSSSNLLLSLKENYKIRESYLGTSNALNYLVFHSMQRLYLLIRRWVLVRFIGKSNYEKLKLLYYKIAKKNKL